MVGNKNLRFTGFLRAAAAGTLFDRPDFTSPFSARKTAQPAIFDVLQASAEDVDTIFVKLMEHFKHVALVCAAGDGLSFMRSLQAIAADVPRFHGGTPFVLPILGLSPHLEFHVVHAGFRNYRYYDQFRFERTESSATLTRPPLEEQGAGRRPTVASTTVLLVRRISLYYKLPDVRSFAETTSVRLRSSSSPRT